MYRALVSCTMILVTYIYCIYIRTEITSKFAESIKCISTLFWPFYLSTVTEITFTIALQYVLTNYLKLDYSNSKSITNFKIQLH